MPALTTDEIPEILARLVDKSLVQADVSGRFSMLQLVRQFSQEEMSRTDDSDETRRKHVLCYADLCAKESGEIGGERLFRTCELFLTESENIRHAIEWAVTDEATWPLAAQMLDDTFWVFFIRGSMTEGISLSSLILAKMPADADPKVRANVWSLLGTYRLLNDHPDAIATCERAIQLSEEAQALWPLSRAILQIAYAAVREGRADDAKPGLSRALELVRQVPGVSARLLELAMLTVKGNCEAMAGRLDEAQKYIDGYRAICETLNFVRGFAILHGNTSHLEERRGDYRSAHDHALKSLETFLKLHDLRNLAGTIASAASGYWLAGDYETAAEVLGCAYAVWGKSELVADAIDSETAERWRGRLRAKMGDPAFADAFERGKATPAKEMVDQLLADPQPWARTAGSYVSSPPRPDFSPHGSGRNA